MDRASLLFTTDKKRLAKFFAKNPVLFSYHSGDLDDFHFDDCQWAVTYGDRPFIAESVLLYFGLAMPTVLAFGLTDRFGPLLEELFDILPPKFYCHFLPEHRELLQKQFKETYLGRYQKMQLTKQDQLANFAKTDSAIVRLDSSHEPVLKQLYDKAYPDNYFMPHMLATNKYLGWYEDDRLAAVAGVHVHSDEYKIAVLGNITTDTDYRGQGLATKLTAVLCQELLAEQKMICLNVKTDNLAAINCYEKLGFEKVVEYDEGFYEVR